MSAKRTDTGKWRATVRIGGRERQRTFRTKREAETWQAKMRDDRDRGSWADPTAGRRTTVRDYSATWMERQTWRPQTRERNVQTFRDHVHPTLGDRPLAGLRPADIDAWVATVSAKLAPSTVAVVRSYLNSMLSSAVRDGLIVANPATGTKLPRPERQRRIVVLEPAEVARWVAEMPDRYAIAVLLGAGTGMRISEVLGLTVDRVDFLRRTIRVDRQMLTPNSAGVPDFGPPKTAAANRTIPAPVELVEALARQVERWGTGDHGLLVPLPDGRPMRRTKLSDRAKAARARAGLAEAVSFHALRHTYASAQIANGVSVKALQVALGHESAAVTLDIYGHLWNTDDDRLRDGASHLLSAVLDAEAGKTARTLRGLHDSSGSETPMVSRGSGTPGR